MFFMMTLLKQYQDATRIRIMPDLMNVNWHSSLLERQGGSEINYEIEDVDEVPNELHDSWLMEREIRENRQPEWLRNQGSNHSKINPNNATILRNDPSRIIVVNPGPRAQPINPPQVRQPAAGNQPRVNIDQAHQDAQVQVRRFARN